MVPARAMVNLSQKLSTANVKYHVLMLPLTRAPTCTPQRRRDLRSVGPAAGPSVRVVAADGVSVVPCGEQGEVVVGGTCVLRARL